MRSTDIDMEAYVAMDTAAAYMMDRAPGMVPFYSRLVKVQMDEPDVTVRINMSGDRPAMEYGVSFVKGMELSLLGSIVYMQCMKVALHHCDRRRKEPSDIYKLASDLVVAEYGRNLVDRSIPGNEDILNRLYPSVWTYWDTFRQSGFNIADDLSLERVFELLMEIGHEHDDSTGGNTDAGGNGREGSDGTDGGADGQDDSTESDDSAGSSGPDGPGKDGSASGPSDNDESAGDSQSADGKGGDESDTGGQEGDQSDSGKMARYFSGMQAAQDLSGWDRNDSASGDIRAAASQADSAGSLDRLPGSLPLMISRANKIRVNVESLFRNFISNAVDDEYEYTWSRRDRRLPRTGIVFSPGRTYGSTWHVLLAVDLSGSMYYMGRIPDCVRVMDGIVNGLSIDVCYWDAACSEIYDSPRSMDEIRLSGGGSTDPRCVLAKVRESRRDYDGIVFITDCEFKWERPDCVRKIMIVNAGRRARPPAWCIYSMPLDDLLRCR